MASKPTDTENKPPTFERAVADLEDIVDQIESGEVGLEEAIARYEQGQKLIQRCRGILDKAERRIAELTEDADGNLQSPGSEAEPDTDDAEDEPESW